MGGPEPIRIGIVGACGRGASFKAACDAQENVCVHAVCDINAEGLDAAAEKLGATEKFTDYGTMLERADIQAVIIATPMHCHVPQAVAALGRGIHVLSEVPAGVSVEECRALVAACKASRATYMMAENYTYTRQNVMVREMAARGLFGTPYYAEGEYLHELKQHNEDTPWRRRWQTGVNGITYGTHSLGPILQWMPGQRVVSVCCAGSGHHYRDPRGDLALLEREKVDVVFMPPSEEMYPPDFNAWVEVGGVTERLEGASRPGHFRGVATVVHKLFDIIQPSRAYFGQKDAQQTIVIRKMVADLAMDLEVVVLPTVRELDGLAMSSRNAYLNPKERLAATVLSKALTLAGELWRKGEKDAGKIKERMTNLIQREPLAEIDYVSIADPQTLEEMGEINPPALVSLAVKIGRTRLIDNVVVG